MKDDLLKCRVCSYKYKDFFPWGEDGKTASFEICDCCGVTFGYEDSTTEGAKKFQEEWIGSGAKWFNESVKPDGWYYKEGIN